jgi:DNA replication and repair protein RecF
MPSALAVTRLFLSHFRSHKAAELALDGRPLAIFGPNGAGKTNLVEAVSLLSPGRGLRGAAPEELARAPERLGWKVAASLASPDGPHEVETWSEGAGRLVAIDGKPAPQLALGAVARVLWLTPAMDRLWLEGAAERRRFLDRIALSLLPDHGEAVLGYEKAMRERNRLLRDQVRDAGWFDALEAQMAAHGARVTANRTEALARLAAAQAGPRNGRDRLPRRHPHARDRGPRRRARPAHRAARRPAAGPAAGRSLTGPHRDDLGAVYAAKGVPARLCSTGEQKALLISLILANARAVAATFGAVPVLILDEVAAHLDATRRAALFDEVAALGAQAWMTGTGAELFEGLGDRAAWLAVAEAEGVSRIDPVAPGGPSGPVSDGHISETKYDPNML